MSNYQSYYHYPYDKYNLKKDTEDNKKCILKFSLCDDNKFKMDNMNSRNIKEFIKFAKKVENMTWKDIRNDQGLKYEAIKQLKPPIYISSDITLHSMRMGQKSRVIGFKENEFFYIVWFDPNHQAY